MFLLPNSSTLFLWSTVCFIIHPIRNEVSCIYTYPFVCGFNALPAVSCLFVAYFRLIIMRTISTWSLKRVSCLVTIKEHIFNNYPPNFPPTWSWDWRYAPSFGPLFVPCLLAPLLSSSDPPLATPLCFPHVVHVQPQKHLYFLYDGLCRFCHCLRSLKLVRLEFCFIRRFLFGNTFVFFPLWPSNNNKNGHYCKYCKYTRFKTQKSLKCTTARIYCSVS